MKDIPDGDVLIHAGDFSKIGSLEEIQKFRSELESLPHKYKVFIAGNHDVTLDQEFYLKCSWRNTHSRNTINYDPKQYSDECLKVINKPTNPEMAGMVKYLKDELFEIPPAEGMYEDCDCMVLPGNQNSVIGLSICLTMEKN